MATRRSTRRTAASAEPTQPFPERSIQDDSAPAEALKTRGRKIAATTRSKTVTKVQVQKESYEQVRATPRAPSVSSTVSATPVRKRATRSAVATGVASPVRQPLQAEKKRKRGGPRDTHSVTPEPAQSEPAQEENNDEQGLFFSKSEYQTFHISQGSVKAPSENDVLRNRIFQLEVRITELEDVNARHVDEKGRIIGQNDLFRDEVIRLVHENDHLIDENGRLVATNDTLAHEKSLLLSQILQSPQRPSQYSSPSIFRFSFFDSSPQVHQTFSHLTSPQLEQSASPIASLARHLPQQLNNSLSLPYIGRSSLSTGQVGANNDTIDFDSHLRGLPEAVPARPMFVNSNEKAIALLHRIENAAKESARLDPTLKEDGESLSDADATTERSLHASKGASNNSATPVRPIATPSNFLSRSFSAIRSIKSLWSTPIPKAPKPAAPSTPARAAPPPNTLTETLSVPPTPVGERIRTPAKKKRSDLMIKALLKGIDPEDKTKAEEWAKSLISGFRGDPVFREKRKRLETPMLVKDLNNFPSSKPWETGFGDPLADLDDEDIVPAWAVYLDMVAEEEERTTKKHKTSHSGAVDYDDMDSVNEQYAASQSPQGTPKLHDSRGHSASLFDFHPRRSIDPSPMFDSTLSHQRGSNVFGELQGHDSATQIRATDLEVLQNATKETVQTHNPGMGSFSVPDDSDDEDSSMLSEASEANTTPAAPRWTQPPPPAPVPAHAPLPVATVAEVPSTSTTQQPHDEIERQRQRLMKHTPAKPSRLREAMYPSPSLMSDAGNESILAATPAHLADSFEALFTDMPDCPTIELDEEDQAAFDALVNSAEYKQQMAADTWSAPIVTYDSDEDDLSPL